MLNRLLVIWITLAAAPALVAADATPAAKPASQRRHSKKSKHAAPKASDACSSNGDCALTPFADGDCCPSLCPQRAVSKTSAEALQRYGATCTRPAAGCAVPECMPQEAAAACQAGHCVRTAAPSRD